MRFVVRSLILVLVMGVLLTPLAGATQHPGKRPRVGYLIAARSSDFPRIHEAFREGLRDYGYVDRQNVVIVVRAADGDVDRLPALVADLVQHEVDVIFTGGTSATEAAKAGAPTIPIVFAGVSDPVGSRLVRNLARPEGNLTGLSLLTPELTLKRLELLKEAVPTLSRVAVLWNPSSEKHAEELENLEAASRSLGVRLRPIAVQRPEEVEGAFAAMSRERAEGLLVLGSAFHHRHLRQIAELAMKHRLAAICEFTEFASAGGLIAYGPNYPDIYRRAAGHVVKILRGARPADLPVEQPTRFDLAINLKTAKALGLTIPQSVLLRADRVIEQ
jgi:putative tryptophan/tyrosine transport system substrate-binding protein